jgi:hypothetical protein
LHADGHSYRGEHDAPLAETSSWQPKSRTPEKWKPVCAERVVHDPSAATAAPDDYFFVQNADGQWDLGHSVEVKCETASVLAAESGVVWLHEVEEPPGNKSGTYFRVLCSSCGHSMRIKKGSYMAGVACPNCAAVHLPLWTTARKEHEAAPSPRQLAARGVAKDVTSRTAEHSPLTPRTFPANSKPAL